MPLGFINASTPFNPTQISGVACALWLDGADSANIQLSGTAVTQWNDKSGNAGHATQSSSGNRPTFTGSGVVFNAASSQYLNLNTTFSSTHSLYIVATPTSASQVYLFGRTYPSGHPSFIINYTGTALEYYAGGDGTTRTTLASPTSTFVAGYVRTFGTGVVARYNGSNIPITGIPATENSSINWGSLGCAAAIYGGFYTGTIYEFIIYNTTLSAPQCLQIESYLSQKWGLVGNLPSNHPGIISRVYPTLTKQIMSPQLYYTVFKPTQIGGCSFWLDGADNTKITKPGAYITQIIDKAGGVTLTATGTTLTTTTINGVQSLNFPGTTFLSGSGSNPSSAYMFFVFTVNSTNNAGYFPIFSWHNNEPVSNIVCFGYPGNATNIGFYESNQGGQSPTTSVSVGTTYLMAASYTGTATTLAVNGAITPTTGSQPTPASAGATSAVYVGVDYGPSIITINLGEIIVFNTSSITNTQRQQVESYLAAKWGLTSSLPTSHLHATQPAGKPVAATQSIINSTLGTLLQFVGVASLSYLPLVTNSTDIGGTPQTVTTNGTVTYTTIGGKQCAYFSNSFSNYLNILYTAQTQVTLCFWLYCIDTGYYTAVSINNNNAAAGTPTLQVDINPTTNNTIIYTAMPNQWANQPTGNYGGPGQWVHFAITLNYSTFVENLYLNGTLAATATGTSGTLPYPQTNIWLGRSGDNWRAYYGYLRQFCTFPTVLTQSQIQAVKTYTT